MDHWFSRGHISISCIVSVLGMIENRSGVKRRSTLGCLGQYTVLNSKWTGDGCHPLSTKVGEPHPTPPPLPQITCKMCDRALENKTNSPLRGLEWVHLLWWLCICPGGKDGHNNNSDLNQCVLHILSKCDGSSLNGWWVIAHKLVIDNRHTYTHTTDEGNDIPDEQNWPRVNTQIHVSCFLNINHNMNI